MMYFCTPKKRVPQKEEIELIDQNYSIKNLTINQLQIMLSESKFQEKKD